MFAVRSSAKHLQRLGSAVFLLGGLGLAGSTLQLLAQESPPAEEWGAFRAAVEERGAVGLAMTVTQREGDRGLAYRKEKEPEALSSYRLPVPELTRAGGSKVDGVIDSSTPTPEAASRGAPVRRSRSLPWVATLEWEVPQEYGADVYEGRRTEFKPWSVFEAELEAARTGSEPPDFLGIRRLDDFVVYKPQESDFSRKLKKLVRAKLYREVRHRTKREWKALFHHHPAMSFADYESRLFQINNIGKNRDDRDDFSVRASATETKQGFLGRRRVDGEDDIPLIAWGPFTVKDTGALKLDLGWAAALDSEEVSLELGEERHVPIVATRDYKVETAFNVDVDPFRGSIGSDPRDAIRQCGLSVEVKWLTDVLGRELFTTEMDLETDLYGDFKGFFNIVLKSR